MGVDIEEACKEYEDDQTTVFIGDQADRAFWQEVRRIAPKIDIVIDDGGHQPSQQIVTLEETLPYLQPGGVFLCEDVHGAPHPFSSYVQQLCEQLNAAMFDSDPNLFSATPTTFQSSVQSIHLYPYVSVIERAEVPIRQFSAPKHGTLWQPFWWTK